MKLRERIANFISGGVLRRLREEYTLVDRRLEDLGWALVSKPGERDLLSGRELFEEAYLRGRTAYRDNPLAAQVCNLTTWYTFGQGVPLPQANDDDVQAIIRAFWEDEDNQLALFSYESQQEMSNKLQWAGELFFPLFLGYDGSIKLSEIDALEMRSVITHPENHRRPLYYLREFSAGYTDNGKRKRVFYPDWRLYLGREDRSDFETAPLPEDASLEPDVFLYHLKVNPLGGRGVSELWRIADWLKQAKRIAEALSTICQAQALFALMIRVKGSPEQIESKRQALMSDWFGSSTTASSLGSSKYQAPPAKGQLWFSDDTSELSAFKVDFGASQLAEAIRQMKLMVSAGSGIFEHYFGDPSTGNLATATAMEMPMLKKFLARQKLWEQGFRDLTHFAIAHAKRSGALDPEADENFDIRFPHILENDKSELAQYLQTMRNLGLISKETAMAQAGIGDVEQELQRLSSELSSSEAR